MLNWHGCLFHWQNRELTNKGIVKATTLLMSITIRTVGIAMAMIYEMFY